MEGSVEINCWLVSVARQPHLSGMNFEVGIQGSVIYWFDLTLRMFMPVVNFSLKVFYDFRHFII